MSHNPLMELIDRGVGQGHLDEYTPFWQVVRGNATRFGLQSTGPLPGYRRASSFQQRPLRHAAILALWIGARDARESYPLWPFAHPHPLSGWPFGKPVTFTCRGLLDIIDGKNERQHIHRRANTGSVPIVNLMLTCGPREAPHCIMMSCRSLGDNPDARARASDTDVRYCRRYADANSIPYTEFDPHCVARPLMDNLLVCSYAVNAVRRDIAPDTLYRVEAELLLQLERETIVDAVRRTASKLGVHERHVWTVFTYMQWTQSIDIDLRYRIFHTERPIPGGRALKAALARLLLGDASWT
ncbi:hypothetical protein G3N95_25070 [Paraburkholderia sp. Tr-20389]|uniref:hypothetical protein n=1 Tax=Paraburkholderia sp. Tr-20389 TaxID=2703903 RepID=UPI00197FE5B1|nr:hypothetical protein [Paraburkholderia sp. Tr-20389]MBN3756235.1 hypothetical protein [Paraburkholderia sp. Tr-20389]